LLSRAENGSLTRDSPENSVCAICAKGEDMKKTVQCESCDRCFHGNCLSLKKIPSFDWFCEDCNVSKICNSCESVKNDKIIVCKGCNKGRKEFFWKVPDFSGYHSKCWGTIDALLPNYLKQNCYNCLHAHFNDFAIPCDKCEKPVYQENFVCCEKCEKMFHLQCQGLKNRPEETDWQCLICSNKNVCLEHKKKNKNCAKCNDSPKKRLSFTARRRKNLLNNDSDEEEDDLSK
jgi:hypothetical protein